MLFDYTVMLIQLNFSLQHEINRYYYYSNAPTLSV